MNDPYIPPADTAFNLWQRTLVEYIAGHAAELPLEPAEIAELQAGQAQWEADFLAHQLAQANARSKRVAKTGSRKSHTRLIRAAAGKLQASLIVTNEHKKGMGIPVRDKIRTRIPPPDTAPHIRLVPAAGGRLRVIARALGKDEVKPDGVYACELWAKIGGDPPAGRNDCEGMGFRTRTSSYLEFTGEQAGQRIYVIGMWINRKGERGPLSATASAIIPG